MKENERRVPIYPEHLPFFPASLRSQMTFESSYGSDYGYEDDYFLNQGAKTGKRSFLLKESDIVVLPKPVPDDLAHMKAGAVLFGWAHCVQQQAITQAAIDRRLTVIAWEAMHHWGGAGERVLHIFHKNNEIAGYAAILHVLHLLGLDGHYGPRRKVVVLGYGSVSRGAIYALQGRGFNNIHIFTRREPHLVANQNPDTYYGQYYYDSVGEIFVQDSDMRRRPLREELAEADIICNGILQDTNEPTMFLKHNEVHYLRPRSIIIDISCDLGMGFPFARPTSFSNPVFQVGDQITYYSVDHTPAYLWNAASREISKALLPFLGVVASSDLVWGTNETIRRAIEIREGVIMNHNILSFQHRGFQYPHAII